MHWLRFIGFFLGFSLLVSSVDLSQIHDVGVFFSPASFEFSVERGSPFFATVKVANKGVQSETVRLVVDLTPVDGDCSVIHLFSKEFTLDVKATRGFLLKSIPITCGNKYNIVAKAELLDFKDVFSRDNTITQEITVFSGNNYNVSPVWDLAISSATITDVVKSDGFTNIPFSIYVTNRGQAPISTCVNPGLDSLTRNDSCGSSRLLVPPFNLKPGDTELYESSFELMQPCGGFSYFSVSVGNKTSARCLSSLLSDDFSRDNYFNHIIYLRKGEQENSDIAVGSFLADSSDILIKNKEFMVVVAVVNKGMTPELVKLSSFVSTSEINSCSEKIDFPSEIIPLEPNSIYRTTYVSSFACSGEYFFESKVAPKTNIDPNEYDNTASFSFLVESPGVTPTISPHQARAPSNDAGLGTALSNSLISIVNSIFGRN